MSPMKISPPNVGLQQRERQLAAQYLARRKRAASRAPWFGVTRDLPNDATDQLDIVQDSIGLVAKPHLGTGGEVLTNDGGYILINEDRLPLGIAALSLRVPQEGLNYNFELGGAFSNYTTPELYWRDEKQVLEALPNGPWRINGSLAHPYQLPGSVYFADPADSSGTPVALNEEYALVHTPETITGITGAELDAGIVSLEITALIARRDNPPAELLDECRLGVYWLNGSSVQIGSAQSAVIGTAAGLNNVWTDFMRSFVAPATTRKFQIRLIAICRDSSGYARLQFDDIRVAAVI